MASAQVLLGILPTILATVGCDPAETSIMGLRRPFLALLVTIGSPAPSLIRSFIYYNPLDILRDCEEFVHTPATGPLRKSIALTFQFLLVIVAVGNTVELALELGFLTVSSFAPSRPWLIILWTILGVLVHVFGSGALRLRVHVQKSGRDQQVSSSSLARTLRDKFSMCSTYGRTILTWTKRETRSLVFMSWFTATGTAAVVVYGTLVFSSLMFISTQDATIIVARYLASALICCAVLMSELNGMRSACKSATAERKGTELQPLTGQDPERVDVPVTKSAC